MVRRTVGSLKKGKNSSVSICLFVCVAVTVSVITATLITVHNSLSLRLDQLSGRMSQVGSNRISDTNKLLIVYNKPPKTGSTTIRVAMSEAMLTEGKQIARCYKMIEWNDMSVRSIINMHDIDFWGCHVRLFQERYESISQMRRGNVAFMTSTRDPSNIILSAYLQLNRNRSQEIMSLNGHEAIQAEVQQFREFVGTYPVDALYSFHGAAVPMKECPPKWANVQAMRNIAERYEVVVDLERADESALMVELVLGVKPVFNQWLNQRTTNSSHPVMKALRDVDTSHKECGNKLVHNTLKQKFNLIKDRLMQNGCFVEETGDYSLCEAAKLTRDSVQRDRNYQRAMQLRGQLRSFMP